MLLMNIECSYGLLLDSTDFLKSDYDPYFGDLIKLEGTCCVCIRLCSLAVAFWLNRKAQVDQIIGSM